MSFNAPNYLITKVVLESAFAKELGDDPKAAAVLQQSADVTDVAADESVADIVQGEIDRYAILSGFLSGTWGLVLPFVVDGQIRDLIDKEQPAQQAQQVPQA